MYRKKLNGLLAIVMLFAVTSTTCYAQGEDSSTAERDIMVIDAMLPGIYANANQSYFDGRGDRDEKHSPLFVDVRSAGDKSFVVTGYFDNDPENALPAEHWSLSADQSSNTVRMRTQHLSLDELENPAAIDVSD